MHPTTRKGDKKTIKKSIKVIGTIGVMTILLCGIYWQQSDEKNKARSIELLAFYYCAIYRLKLRFWYLFSF